MSEENSLTYGFDNVADNQLLMLVRRFVDGDITAFERLMEKVIPVISPVISRFTFNYDDGQDLSQEITIHLFNSLSRFRNECKLSTFIYRISMNTCINFKKKKLRGPLSFTDLTPADSEDNDCISYLAVDNNTPERNSMHREKEKALHSYIINLDPNFRAVFILTDVCGMSQQEIADILQIPLNTVKTRQSRSREQLRKKINENRELFDRAS